MYKEKKEVIVKSGKRENPDEKYCSCVFLVTSHGRPGNPYAICRKSIYERRGITPPPVALRCVYTREYLMSLKPVTLMTYILNKRIRIDDEFKEKLVDVVLNYFERTEARRKEREEEALERERAARATQRKERKSRLVEQLARKTRKINEEERERKRESARESESENL
jgi:hypothetical protein